MLFNKSCYHKKKYGKSTVKIFAFRFRAFDRATPRSVPGNRKRNVNVTPISYTPSSWITLWSVQLHSR